ncbi:MAG: helix-turn-helix domain-containing protein [Pirellulales bacterium]
MLPFFELDGPAIADSSNKPADTEDSLSASSRASGDGVAAEWDSDGTESGSVGSATLPGSGLSGTGGTGTGAVGRLPAVRVLLLGKLASMPRREAIQIIRQQGGVVVAGQSLKNYAQDIAQGTDELTPIDVVQGAEGGAQQQVSKKYLGQSEHKDKTDVTMIVVGDDASGWRPLLQQRYPAIAQAVDSGQIELLQESEFWRRVGLMESPDDVRRLYTPAMLAELLNVSVSAIRRWVRQGTLVACCQVRRLPYFDFAEVSVARHLADLHNAGCSLHVIDRKLRELAAMMPESPRPLAEPGVVVEGRRLFIRRGDELEEPSGQRQLDFDCLADEEKVEGEQIESIPLSVVDLDTAGLDVTASTGGADLFAVHDGLGIDDRAVIDDGAIAVESSLPMLEQLLQEAVRHEDQGSLELAVESYRAILMAGGPAAEINFALADLLYRQGDANAARERYYMAIEMDEEYVEARANLGCLLAEMDELEMAIAAFQGALAYHIDYADVHYHMAGALDRLQRHREAQFHWRTFLALAPESAWAEVARMQLSDKS